MDSMVRYTEDLGKKNFKDMKFFLSILKNQILKGIKMRNLKDVGRVMNKTVPLILRKTL